jgi:hypothetical protein
MTFKRTHGLSTAFSSSSKDNTAPPASRGLLGLCRKVRRAILVLKLRREAQQQLASFFRVAGEMGMPANCQQHPASQLAKLSRVNQIADQLRVLRYGSSR